MKNEPRPRTTASQCETTSTATGVVALLCLGSLGDCLPLCALAASLPSHFGNMVRPSPPSEVTERGSTISDDNADCRNGIGNMSTTTAAAARCLIVTHRCHCDLLRGLMSDVYDVADPPELYPVDLPILFSPGQRADTGKYSGGASGEESIGDDEEGGVSRELDVCIYFLRGIRPKALVFNLYSSFGYHLADALGIPCACASPGVAPSIAGGVPLRRLLPRALLERLDKELDPGEENKERSRQRRRHVAWSSQSRRSGRKLGRKGGRKRYQDGCSPVTQKQHSNNNNNSATENPRMLQISKADLELWMLPLFLPRYRRWRLRHGLPPIPCWPIRESLPPATPVMFGVSPTVLPRPGYWPHKADVCGFWSFPELSRRYRAPERLEKFLERCDSARRPIFCVGLGSMPSLGLVQDSFRVVSMAASCLLQAGAGVVLLPHGALSYPERDESRHGFGAAGDNPAVGIRVEMGGIVSACPETKKRRCGETIVDEEPHPREHDEQEVLKKEAQRYAFPESLRVKHEFVLDLEGSIFVPHCWLLPRCRGIVHHGGSGTTGAALSAGAVQVVIPYAFDQFFFADQVEHMGVGVRVPGTHPSAPRGSAASRPTREEQTGGVTREGLQSAVDAVLRHEFRESAERYRALLTEEDGVRNACEAIVAGLKMDLGAS